MTIKQVPGITSGVVNGEATVPASPSIMTVPAELAARIAALPALIAEGEQVHKDLARFLDKCNDLKVLVQSNPSQDAHKRQKFEPTYALIMPPPNE